LPGSTDVLPVVRSTQYASDGPPARAVNVNIENVCYVGKQLPVFPGSFTNKKYFV
jgi:hypothetical protein